MENEFPPNSHSKREARPARRTEKAPDRKDVRRVTTNKVILRKKPLYKKFLEAFRPEDNVGFVEHTLLDVLVPGIKDAMADAVHGTIDNAFGTSGGTRRRRRDGGYTSYNRMSSSSRSRGRDRDRDDDRRPKRRERDDRMADDVREIIVDSRPEAEEILDTLIELASKWDQATMRDLLSMIGEPHNSTHEDWGWFDLRGARIHRVSGGYLLDLPRPEYLD